AACLSLGSILCFPLFAAHLPHYAGNRPLGGYYGFYASLGGCVALIANVLIGGLLGEVAATPPAAIWYGLALCGMVAGWALYRQLRREELESPADEPPAAELPQECPAPVVADQRSGRRSH
ncbi:MAG: hypothetical protein R3311_01200, partial [Oceanisphaera sp.]|nr:hypothetical protein [Oceanisphaera sp.]